MRWMAGFICVAKMRSAFECERNVHLFRCHAYKPMAKKKKNVHKKDPSDTQKGFSRIMCAMLTIRAKVLIALVSSALSSSGF